MPYDYAAIRAYRWMVHHNIAIPEDYSMLSFDNGVRAIELSIASVDFGFGHLGYEAFHALYGVVIRGRRTRVIDNRPRVMPGQSFGLPRRSD
jgi:DNA-binding LacI/PurR family transcriptional regulator